MRRVLIVVSMLLFLTTAVSTASAQNIIDLGGSSTAVTFNASGGGNWTLTWGALTGTAQGYGIYASGPAAYSITGTGVTINGTLTSSSPTQASWSVTQSAPLSFSYGPSGSLLAGNLQLVNLSVSGLTGNFDTTLTVNLTSLTGSLASSFTSAGGVVTLTLQFPSSALALDSLASGATLSALLSSGEIIQTPEPVSMLLVGSGLLSLGALVRRRRKT
jgi:hypothetical protein